MRKRGRREEGKEGGRERERMNDQVPDPIQRDVKVQINTWISWQTDWLTVWISPSTHLFHHRQKRSLSNSFLFSSPFLSSLSLSPSSFLVIRSSGGKFQISIHWKVVWRLTNELLNVPTRSSSQIIRQAKWLKGERKEYERKEKHEI